MKNTKTPFRFYDLENKTLLITGTTRGIGKALLPGLMEQGLNLILLSRNLERMRAIREELGASESQMQLYECDLSQPETVVSTAQAILESGASLDAILHNAAIDPRHEFEDYESDVWPLVWQVNLNAAVKLTQYLLPLLHQSTQGRVLFTGSIMADLGGSYLTAYNTSKGALHALTRSLAHELKHSGITVNCIVPGAISVEKESGTPESHARLIGWQSVERRLEPADLLGAICLFLSRAGGGISGQSLTIDGGLIHPLADPTGQKRRLERDKDKRF